MKEQAILKGNKLIAEFMEAQYQIETKRYYFTEEVSNSIYCGLIHHEEQLCYHTFWDWLMPVVEKIETLGYRFSISTTFIRVHTCKTNWDGNDEYNCAAFDGKLNTTYHAIVEFIKWYNENKRTQIMKEDEFCKCEKPTLGKSVSRCGTCDEWFKPLK